MGILPLQFLEGQQAKTLGLTGKEKFTINIHGDIKPGQLIEVQVFLWCLYFLFVYVISPLPMFLLLSLFCPAF